MKKKTFVLLIVLGATLLACGLVPLFSFVSYNVQNPAPTQSAANIAFVER